MLFNAELKNIKIAILNIKAGKTVDAHNKIIQAQKIMDELLLSLDFKYPISKELQTLYLFIKRELISANIKKDTEKLEKLLPLITELRDTWEQADKLARKQV